MKKSPASLRADPLLRQRAEKFLREQSPRKTRLAAKSTPDNQLTFHELQVHQIELELQNEELQQAKTEVDAHLEKYTDLYDFAPVGYFSIDEKGMILDVNLTGATLFRVERSKLINRRFQVFTAPAYRASFNLFLTNIFAGHRQIVCETSVLRTDHPPFWADLQAMSAIVNEGARKWCRLAVMDASIRKHAEEAQRRVDDLAATNKNLEKEIVRRLAEEASLKKSEQRALQSLIEAQELQTQLRRVAHQFLMVEENQRRQISRELHDKICQLLVGINVHLALFAQTAVSDPKSIHRKLAPLRRLVAGGVKIVHKFACDLRPSALDELGLIPALRSFVKGLPKRKGRLIEFAAPHEIGILSNDKQTVLYRVAQQALTNAIKHAKSTLIQVTVRKVPKGISLEVADNGKGFNLTRKKSALGNRRLGLVGMRERVEMVGGTLVIDSIPGKGTSVRTLLV